MRGVVEVLGVLAQERWRVVAAITVKTDRVVLGL
jgi:hypothetical protein